MFCWHKWRKWEVMSGGKLLSRRNNLLTDANYTPEERYPVGRYEIQRRECEKCGKSKLREVRSK